MGHHISAIIGKAPINKEKADEYDLPYFVENSFVIVALEASHIDFWDKKLGYGYEKMSKLFMDSKCTHFFAQEIGLSNFAIIFTDYFGGSGSQSATVYNSGKQILPPTENGVNKALRKIGVERSLFKDEFDTIGLGKYRHWEGLFEKYEDL